MADLTNYNKLINNLDELRMFQMKDTVANYIQMVSAGDKNFTDALYELTEKEKAYRKEVAMNACVKTAGFPFIRRLNDYDFSFQPSLNKAEVEDLLSLSFIPNYENILFIGSPGVGKTHLATAIGIEAALHRYSVHFMTCQQMINQLKTAENENRLEKLLKQFFRYKVLIIDEVGYLNLDKRSANLFFQLISMRYEKKSTFITTNKPLSKWAEIFTDPVITNAILDRLLHHSKIFNIIGPSYRTKDILEEITGDESST